MKVAPWFLNHWVPNVKLMLPAYVESVHDGDTCQCWARVPLEDYPAYPTIRLAVVDCPEIDLLHAKGGPLEVELGMKAAAWVRATIMGQQVGLVPSPSLKDDRDRWLCAIIYRDARGGQHDLATELTARRFLKSDVPAYAAATDAERAVWGSV